MKRLLRLFFYLILNVIVTAVTMWMVLSFWNKTRPNDSMDISPLALLSSATPSPTRFIPPTNTPDIQPSATIALEAYRVGLNETLLEIAIKYDTSVEQLLELNGLTNPDSLGVGTVLYVPKLEQEGTPTPESAASTEEPEGTVSISTVVGAGDLESEYVQLRGSGGSIIMTDWVLLDDDGNVYAFPQITLFPNGSVNVHTRAGLDNVVDLYWNKDDAVWDQGDIVTLLDPEGNILATYQVP